MFLLQKNVPNFKVIEMFVFAYCTTALITIYRKIILQKYGDYKLNPARYVTKFGIIIQVGRGYDVFKCFVTCESVYLSF